MCGVRCTVCSKARRSDQIRKLIEEKRIVSTLQGFSRFSGLIGSVMR